MKQELEKKTYLDGLNDGYKQGYKEACVELCEIYPSTFREGKRVGIKEVVDTYKRENPWMYTRYEAWWQAKKEEWGIE
jgi:hypothetical protein